MNIYSQRTQGASLFVVVLMVLLLLSAVVAVTAQIALSSRRSANEQEMTLRAQYAADSTIARAQARISVINNLFKGGGATYNNVATGIRVPQGTRGEIIENYIATLCGVTSLPALASQTVPVCGSTAINSNILSGVADPSPRLELFTANIGGTNIISDAALAAVGGPAVGSSLAQKQAFWSTIFGGSNAINVGTTINGMNTQGTVGAVISSVWHITDDEYEIHIRVPDINVLAAGSTASRSIKVGPKSEEYVLSIGRPPLAKYALFSNHHFTDAATENGCTSTATTCNRITFTSNTRFTGPVHTNEQFTIQGDPLFSGPLTSAGCVAGSIIVDANSNSSCTSQVPGAYFYGTDFESGSNPPSVLLNSDGTVSTSPKYNTSLGQSSPRFSAPNTPTQPAVKWDADFMQLPPNGNDQRNDALTGGLLINGDVTNMSLKVGNITVGGTSQKTQQISYTSVSPYGTSSTVKLAINSSNQVFISSGTTWLPAKSTNGVWTANTATAAPGSFNGVVYVDGDVSNLNGPSRSPTTASTSTSANTAPAIADFMKLNVTASGDVGISSDLRYENPPCDDVTTQCNNESAQNIFGIYSATGDVKILSKYCSNGSYNCGYYGTRSPSVPPNVSVQAVLMAGQGKVTVDGYSSGPANASDRGTVNLVGGVIENYYGAFGVVSGQGYGRNFVYDTRTGKGVLPPSFPTTRNWTSDFANQIKFNNGTQIQQSNSEYNSATQGSR